MTRFVLLKILKGKDLPRGASDEVRRVSHGWVAGVMGLGWKRNIALLVEFDGTLLHGWQSQKSCRSVQVEIEKAVCAVMGPSTRLNGCSRTDAGVHAEGHISNFSTDSPMPVEKIALALNSRLPGDIAVKAAVEVPATFHARHDAIAKTYVYRLWNLPSPPTLRRFDTCHIPRVLDLDRMNAAAKHLEGRHDFTTFMAAGSAAASPVRTLHRVEVRREGPLVVIEVQGDGFLYNMVRIVAGTLCSVGFGKIAPGEIPEILESRERKRAGKTMPARGLSLVGVEYPDALFSEYLRIP